MTEQNPSPWAESNSNVEWISPSSAPKAPTPAPNEPQGMSLSTNPASAAPAQVSRTHTAPQPYGQRAAIILVGGLCVILAALIIANMLVDSSDPASGDHGTSSDIAEPPLAKLCPRPEQEPTPGAITAPPEGPRVSDPAAGISYSQWGDPFHSWDRGIWGQGELGVEFGTGYYFVTETYSGGDYLASVLSGSVPATVGDSLTVNLECAGKQVAEDVRRAYYPQPNERVDSRNEYTTLGGLPAWVTVFHLDFSDEGLQAKGETVAVITVDVGRPSAAVLYVSVPDTHKQEWVPPIDSLIASVRPA
ncbi:MAG: hypothetical protein HOQ05_02565 [Corynebacteriales bacterium]|nr:hypothetical protein [Mycobacteriales bacterium]